MKPKAKITILTISEAAELVDGLSKSRIRQMCIDGTLPHLKVGNKYLINQNTLFTVLSCAV